MQPLPRAAALPALPCPALPCPARWGAGVLVELAACGLGHSMSCAHLRRWQGGYEACLLDGLPHRQLTAPVEVLDVGFGFDQPGGHSPVAGTRRLTLQVQAAGLLNAVAFWFDLGLGPGGKGGGAWLSNMPACVRRSPGGNGCGHAPEPGGCEGEQQGHHWGQALQYLERCCQVQPGAAVQLEAALGPDGLSFALANCAAPAAAPAGQQQEGEEQQQRGEEQQAAGEEQQEAQGETGASAGAAPLQLLPAPRSPWKVGPRAPALLPALPGAAAADLSQAAQPPASVAPSAAWPCPRCRCPGAAGPPSTTRTASACTTASCCCRTSCAGCLEGGSPACRWGLGGLRLCRARGALAVRLARLLAAAAASVWPGALPVPRVRG